jgi:muramoyltetrapeptide carboxypeptidase
VKLGSVTARGTHQGYRSASPRDRASEINELFADSNVHALMSTVGGWNTSSVVEHLDYTMTSKNPKVVSGFSDVTSLHCALMTKAGLSTFYGPAVFPSFGEWPE